VSNISEHDTEQEWEGHAGKHCWVHLFVSRDTVSVDNLLEDNCEFILSEERRRLDVVAALKDEGGLLDVFVVLLHLLHCILHVLVVTSSNPRESEEYSVLFFKFV
jgi:hypothetical protein